ncbi:hypothetical protein EVAR_87277_1 [Eumeta japonica]|uniref:Uncharacterized protein n=1 Tax=Eumeta variegata TaxID=151549 RepID=A0A4C1VUS6_EUMVA|nr:hypothetical protein EVAR_87277_1 [Eumeta japonica]
MLNLLPIGEYSGMPDKQQNNRHAEYPRRQQAGVFMMVSDDVDNGMKSKLSTNDHRYLLLRLFEHAWLFCRLFLSIFIEQS